MRQSSQKRRRARTAAGSNATHAALAGLAGVTGEGVWLTVSGHGSGFHDCPLCRELGPDTEALVGIREESLPELLRAGWIANLLDLVGRDATVRVMGHEMEKEPVEELSLASFIARLGYE
ncbi:MAG: hypothetical protein ABI689_09655 [Thermoanaerobaculia bacterium]